MRVLKRGYAGLLRPALRAPRCGAGHRRGRDRRGGRGLPADRPGPVPRLQGARLPHPLRHQAGHLAPGAWTARSPGCSISCSQIPGVTDVGSHIGTAPLGEEINGVELLRELAQPVAGRRLPEGPERGPGRRVPPTPAPTATCRPTCTSGSTRCSPTAPPTTSWCASTGPDLQHAGHAGQPARRGAGQDPRPGRRPPGRRSSSSRRSTSGQPRPPRQRYGLTPGEIRRAAAIMMASEPMSEISSRRRADRGRRLEHPCHPAEPGTSLRQLPIDTPSGGARARCSKVATIPCSRAPARSCGRTAQRYTEVDADVSGQHLSSVTGAVQGGAGERSSSRLATATRCWARRPSGPPRSAG